jgi:hypothetical protein
MRYVLFCVYSNKPKMLYEFASNFHQIAGGHPGWHPSCFLGVRTEEIEPMNTQLASNVRKLRRSGTGPSAGRRLRANWPAELRTDGTKAHCTVVDVSSEGANLLIDAPLSGDAPLWLIVENVGPIAASVAWQQENRVGLCFLEEQEWVFQASKKRFDPAAWLNSN